MVYNLPIMNERFINSQVEQSLGAGITLLNRVGPPSSLTEQEVGRISESYGASLRENIDFDITTNLKMVDTLINPLGRNQLKPGQRAWVFEMGGSHFYGAEVEINNAGDPVISSDPQGRKKYLQIELRTRKFLSVEDYFKKMLVELQPLFSSLNKPNSVGIIFSFPGDPIKTSNGIDVISPETLQKEFVIPGISDRPVGVVFNAMLQEQYKLAVEKYAVLNDTPAVLLADRDRKIGGVVGTGANLAIVIDGKLYNTTTGGTFVDIPTYPLFYEMDEKSGSKGKFLAAKQMGGIYLNMQFQETIRLLVNHGLLPHLTTSKLPESLLADFLRNNPSKINSYFEEELSFQSEELLSEAARRLINRSAQMMGTFIGTIVQTFPSEFGQNEQIPMEGSLFWQAPGYKEMAQRYAQRMLQQNTGIQFVHIDNAGILGCAAAAICEN